MRDLKKDYYNFKMKFFYRFLKNDEFIYILVKSGIKVGKGTQFYDPRSISIDRSRTYLLSIGEFCKITSGVVILTHDYSRSVLRRVYGQIIGEGAKTIIGNNVFIGMNSIILMGSKIGNNVIVGAGSVVSGQFPDNVVIAGNPARVIKSLEEYYEKRKESTINEAKECARAFYSRFNRIPTIKEMDPFFPLFLERNLSLIKQHNLNVNLNGDDPYEVIEVFLDSKPIFENFETFLDFCELTKNDFE